MFEKRIEKAIPVEAEGVSGLTLDVWKNPPLFLLEQVTSDEENEDLSAADRMRATIEFLQKIVTGWNLGGHSYEGFEFPSTPTSEAWHRLPSDVFGACMDTVIGGIEKK